MTNRDPERIYTPTRDETAGLGLFAAQREAAPDVAHDPVRRATVHAVGAGQAARTEARDRARHGSEDAYRRIALALEGHGPSTRKELAGLTALCCNTVNARVSEMREMPAGSDWRVHTDGRRHGESIVHLSRLTRAAP